jgi:hypothetical protein
MMNKIKWFILLATLAAVACNKDTNTTPATANLSVYMTDSPDSIFSSVDINLTGIELIKSNGDSTRLSSTTQIFNVLTLTNGNNLLISSGPITTDSIVSVRLLFGSTNTLSVGNNIYPLQLTSSVSTLLPINLKVLANSSYSILVDLDVPQSITETGGQFFFTPSIRFVNNQIDGSIQGNIDVAVLGALVSVTDGINTYSSYTNQNGQFQVTGIPAGTYIVTVFPPAPYNAEAKSDVVVTANTITKIGTLVVD